MKQITIKTDNKEYIFDVFKNDNTGRSFVLKNEKYMFVYSYNTLVYGENTQEKISLQMIIQTTPQQLENIFIVP
jgi:hypothetical protein